MTDREAVDMMRSALIESSRPPSIVAELFVAVCADFIRQEPHRRKLNLEINRAIRRAEEVSSPELETLLAIKRRLAVAAMEQRPV